MQTRIYTVSDGNTDRLVRSASRAGALAHVARSTFKTRVATQEDLETLLTSGVKVEDATAQQPDGE